MGREKKKNIFLHTFRKYTPQSPCPNTNRKQRGKTYSSTQHTREPKNDILRCLGTRTQHTLFTKCYTRWSKTRNHPTRSGKHRWLSAHGARASIRQSTSKCDWHLPAVPHPGPLPHSLCACRVDEREATHPFATNQTRRISPHVASHDISDLNTGRANTWIDCCASLLMYLFVLWLP